MEETGHSGFTLIELLITVSLVAVLAALAVPAMAHFVDSARLRGAAEVLVQELRQARNRALTFQQTVYFSFRRDTANNWCYGWSGQASCDCRLDAGEAGACLGGDGRDARLHRQLSIGFPTVMLTIPANVSGLKLQFAPVRGTASAASIRLGNNAGDVRVIVSPLGRVRTCASQGRVFARC